MSGILYEHKGDRILRFIWWKLRYEWGRWFTYLATDHVSRHAHWREWKQEP